VSVTAAIVVTIELDSCSVVSLVVANSRVVITVEASANWSTL
jgi:hypothetical protein